MMVVSKSDLAKQEAGVFPPAPNLDSGAILCLRTRTGAGVQASNELQGINRQLNNREER